MDKEIWNNVVVKRVPFFSVGGGALASGVAWLASSSSDHAFNPLVTGTIMIGREEGEEEEGEINSRYALLLVFDRAVGGGVLGSLLCVAFAAFGPVQQIYSLAKKNSQEIMEFVGDSLSEGSQADDDEEEDLLLKWAPKAIIDDRDEYMFRYYS